MHFHLLIWILGIIASDDELYKEDENYYDLSDFFEIERSEGRIFSDSPLSDQPDNNDDQFTEYYYEAPIYSGVIEADLVANTDTLKPDEYDYVSVYDSSSSSEFDHLRLQIENLNQVHNFHFFLFDQIKRQLYDKNTAGSG